MSDSPQLAIAPSASPLVPSRTALPDPRPRLWPGVLLVALQWTMMTVPGWIVPGTMIEFMIAFNAPMVAGLGIVVWWLFFSRVRWRDRFLVLGVCAVCGAAAYPLYHSTFDVMGVLFYTLPALTTAWVGLLVLTPFLSWPVRRTILLMGLALVWGSFALLRFDGVWGAFSAQFSWRWSISAEQKSLAELASRKSGVVAEGAKLEAGDWPGFRGANRDGRLTGVRLATNWDANPPKQLWKQRILPGWSSFAVVGPRLYTQEQQEQQEAVVCFEAATGATLWTHRDETRFEEPLAGAGPRATPTFHEGKIYALGATGRLNCLDAVTGKLVWTRDVKADSGAKPPKGGWWGFSSSPLVAQGIVTVFAGAGGKSVLGYHADTGYLAWDAGKGQASYCSTQLARLSGVEQILLATDLGVTSFHPASGKELWQYDWALGDGFARVVQPAVLNDTDLLVGTGFGNGTRRFRVTRDGEAWKTEEVWDTKRISPYYNDFVTHKGHLYGFDMKGIFTCVSLEDGSKKWSERGYGHGQVLLLADQDMLLILSEKGEVVLVEATPEARKERGRFQAIEGKTWNHPVVAHGKLFVRNGEEMACYQLVEEGK